MPSPARSKTPDSSKSRPACHSAISSTISAAEPRRGPSSKQPRLADPPAAVFPNSTSTSLSTTSPFPNSAPSWASGGLIVMDEDSCMVDVARYFLEFVQEESCEKMRSLPRRYKADARNTQSHLQWPGRGIRRRTTHRPRRNDQGDIALWLGPDGSQPRALHDPPLRPRVRGTHSRQTLPCRCLPVPGLCPLFQRMSSRRRYPRLRIAGRRKSIRGGPQTPPREEPIPGHLLSRLFSTPAKTSAVVRCSMLPFRSAASSDSWSIKR